jgi:hypothetical protein
MICEQVTNFVVEREEKKKEEAVARLAFIQINLIKKTTA